LMVWPRAVPFAENVAVVPSVSAPPLVALRLYSNLIKVVPERRGLFDVWALRDPVQPGDARAT
jgi:hypothetical protein